MKNLLKVGKLIPEFIKGMNIHLIDINPFFINKQKNNLIDYYLKISWYDKVEYINFLPSNIYC